MDCGYEQIAKWDEAGEWCYIHGHEPVLGHPYKVCGECFHAYMTPEELLITSNNENYKMWFAWEQGAYPWIPETDADNINFCAYCTHDF